MGLRRTCSAGLAAALLLLLLAGCGRGPGVIAHLEEPFPSKLSEWQLFVEEPRALKPNTGVVPYDLNTPLFSDYAVKRRFVWMPAGSSANYHPSEAFEFPVGTIISKTFLYPDKSGAERLLETRLLVHAASGWVGLPYVWDDAQTEATLAVAGDILAVRWTHPSGREYDFDYLVPNVNQCRSCHDKSKRMVPIGPKAANLNREFAYAGGRYNQLDYWTRIGFLKGAPNGGRAPQMAVWDDPGSGTVEERARAYLDVNCAHCHNPASTSNTAGLYLGMAVQEPWRLGVCKVPVAAGAGAGDLRFDIVAGRPDASILVRRMESATPKVAMPELGRSLVHQEAVALIREWIAHLPRDPCASGHM